MLHTPALAPDSALAALVRRHLGAYGPVTRRDIAWWTGEGLTRVDDAVAHLGDVVEHIDGADGGVYLNLADRPVGPDPGTRLLAEFDGLLLGFALAGRDRFVSRDNLPLLYRQVNGLFRPAVLHEGRLVATWRLDGAGPSRVLKVEVLPGERAPGTEALAPSIAALGAALDLEVSDVSSAP